MHCFCPNTHNILAIEQKRKRKFDMGNEAVVMTNVCKDFKVLNRHEGLKGSIKDLEDALKERLPGIEVHLMHENIFNSMHRI